jgi:hypothetical protein
MGKLVAQNQQLEDQLSISHERYENMEEHNLIQMTLTQDKWHKVLCFLS